MNKKETSHMKQNVESSINWVFRLNVGRKFHLLQSFLYFMPVGSFSHNFRMECPRDKFSRFYFSVVIDFLYNKKRQSWNPPLTAIFVVCDFEQQLRTSLQKTNEKLKVKYYKTRRKANQHTDTWLKLITRY